MLLKLLTLATLANMALCCCLPDSFQFTMLSESRHPSMGSSAMRARVVMAADGRQGKAGIFTFTDFGYNSMIYANLRSGKVHINSPPYGCYEMPIDSGILSQLNQSRCVPDDMTNSTIPIRLADSLNARLYSKIDGNGTLNVLITETCKPILVKVSGPDFDSTNILGDFFSEPQPGVLDLPAECRNATSVGLGASSKKRAAVSLGYNRSPLMV